VSGIEIEDREFDANSSEAKPNNKERGFFCCKVSGVEKN